MQKRVKRAVLLQFLVHLGDWHTVVIIPPCVTLWYCEYIGSACGEYL